MVTCQDQKSQIKNFEKALQVLKSRFVRDRAGETERRDWCTTVDQWSRAATAPKRIRTYNYPQSRVTDHRINHSSHNLSAVVDGDLSEFVEQLRMADNAERMQEGEGSLDV